MTKSSTAPSSEQETSPRRSPGPVRSFLTLIFRLLLLGIGGGVAGLIGVAIAQFYPAQPSNQPILEAVFRRSGELFNSIQPGTSPTRPAAFPSAAAPTSAPDAANPTPTATVTVPPAVIATSQTQTLMVTLPSDTLFGADPNTFRSESQVILDSIVGDLQQYPRSAIRVAAHTDSQGVGSPAGSSQENRVRSFAQAQLIERYLVNRLGDQYHWSVVGYGDTRPIVSNDTPTNRQRNRRIEITIDPQ